MTLCPVPYPGLNINTTISELIYALRSKDVDHWCMSALVGFQRQGISEPIEYYPYNTLYEFNRYSRMCYICYSFVFYILAIHELVKLFKLNLNYAYVIIKSLTLIILGITQITLIYAWNKDISTVMIEYQNIILLSFWLFSYITLGLGIYTIIHYFYHTKYKLNYYLEASTLIIWIWILQLVHHTSINTNLYWIYSQTISDVCIVLLIILWFLYWNKIYIYVINVVLLFTIATLPLINMHYTYDTIAFTQLTDDTNPWRFKIWIALGIVWTVIGILLIICSIQVYNIINQDFTRTKNKRMNKNSDIDYSENENNLSKEDSVLLPAYDGSLLHNRRNNLNPKLAANVILLPIDRNDHIFH